MAQDAAQFIPALLSRPKYSPRLREPATKYPEQQVTKIEKELNGFDVSRNCFFKLSLYTHYADWIVGSLAAYNSAYLAVYAAVASFNALPFIPAAAAIPISPPRLALYVGPTFLAFHYYAQLHAMSERYFEAAVSYSILYRRSKAILSLDDGPEKNKLWAELQELRDNFEGKYSLAIPQTLQLYVKEEIKAEEEAKKNPNGVARISYTKYYISALLAAAAVGAFSYARILPFCKAQWQERFGRRG